MSDNDKLPVCMARWASRPMGRKCYLITMWMVEPYKRDTYDDGHKCQEGYRWSGPLGAEAYSANDISFSRTFGIPAPKPGTCINIRDEQVKACHKLPARRKE